MSESRARETERKIEGINVTFYAIVNDAVCRFCSRCLFILNSKENKRKKKESANRLLWPETVEIPQCAFALQHNGDKKKGFKFRVCSQHTANLCIRK